MDKRSNTKCKNTKLIVDAMRLADKMLVMAQNGVPECEDDSCMMIYGIIRFYSPFAGCCGELNGEGLPLGV